MESIGIAVLGAGRIGRLHAENAAHRIPGVALKAVCDVRLDAARALAGELGAALACEDPDEAIGRDDVDAVLVCSSTDTHADLIERAARAGKHVFCEKPIALDLEVIDRALETVASAGVTLQVGFNRRFDPSFRRLHDLVRGGALGAPHMLRISSRDPEPPPLDYVKVSGGLFLDMAIHDFDMARFQMGCEAEEIFATGAALVDPAVGELGDIDTAVICLRFANGALGCIDNSRRAVYGYDQRVEVFGSKGMAAAGNRKPDSVELSDAEAVRGAKPLYFFTERYAESYLEELRAFVQAVRDGAPSPVTGLDGRMPVVMGLAARRSLEQGRPVRLEEIEY
ncbi:MAG: inositol 2-dehydrogenase [Deltaproteobacteria bacterium]|nr:inositol 2-dehydrogenase [Deltaproteobacteria bacterium]